MKSKLLTFSFLSLLAVSQLSFINSKNTSLITRTNDNPYIPYSDDATTYSGKSFGLVPDNNNISTNYTRAYFQVYDNANKDFYKYMRSISYPGPVLDIQYTTTSGEVINTVAAWEFWLSDIKRSDTYVIRFLTDANSENLYSINGRGEFAFENPENDLNNDYLKWEDLNNDDLYDKESISHYYADDTYPYIDKYSELGEDIIQINSLSSNGELTFTIKVHNWTDSTENPVLTQEDEIGVTMLNMNEPDNYLRYEQYQAHLIDTNGDYYTYKIEGLQPDTTYKFYALDYTGLTIGSSNEYYPTVLLEMADLGYEHFGMTINTEPHIDTTYSNDFAITKTSAKSIEFSLKIVDITDKYLNHLKNEDDTIDVTLVNLDDGKTINTEAKFVDEQNDVFTFKIKGLDSFTNYQIISLNNMGINVNSAIDNEILLYEDLGVEKTESSFITENNTVFITFMILVIIILLLIIGLIAFYFLFFKRKSIKNEVKAIKTDSSWSIFN